MGHVTVATVRLNVLNDELQGPATVSVFTAKIQDELYEHYVIFIILEKV